MKKFTVRWNETDYQVWQATIEAESLEDARNIVNTEDFDCDESAYIIDGYSEKDYNSITIKEV